MEKSGQIHALAALTPGRVPATQWIGGWLGTRARMEAVVEGKIPCPSRVSNPSIPVRSLYWLRYCI